MTREGLDASKGLFEEAIRLDPELRAGPRRPRLLLVFGGLPGFRRAQGSDAEGQGAVRRAIELDESVAEAHATLGVILALYDWDWAGGRTRTDAFHRTERRFAGVARRLCVLLSAPRGPHRGGGRRKCRMRFRSIRCRFCSASISAFCITCSSKYEHSIAQFRKVLEMSPQYYLAHAMMGNCLHA